MLFELDLVETLKEKKRLEIERQKVIPTLVHAEEFGLKSDEEELRENFKELQEALNATTDQMAEPWSILEGEYRRFIQGGPIPERIAKIINFGRIAGSLDWILRIERTVEAVKRRYAKDSSFAERIRENEGQRLAD